MGIIRLSKRLIEKGKSSNSSWSSEQLKILGIIPLKDWKSTVHLIQVPYEKYKKFLELKDKHVKNKSKNISSESSTHKMLPLSHYLQFQTLEEIEAECPFDLDYIRFNRPVEVIKKEK